MIRSLKFFTIIGLGLVTHSTLANGLLLNDENLRNDLNWLNHQGVIQISTSTWPLSEEAVIKAIQDANINNKTQQKVVESVLAHVKSQNESFRVNLFAETDPQYLPQKFGDNTKSQYQVGVQLKSSGENWAGQLKINAENDLIIDHDQKVNIEGSYLAGKFWNQWIVAGQIPTYWGPGHDGSLIRGDASRPVYGVTLQRADQAAFETKWLSWIGPWQYQVFAGQLDDYIISGTNLLGIRLTAQPLPYLELGASRTIQIDGEGQPDSLKAYWNAFIGKDNECDESGCVGEGNASNQIAGLDARLNLNQWFNIPLSLYGQFVGEDESGLFPSRKMYLAGFDYSSQIKNMPFQIYTEWSDTRTNGDVWGYSYNHHNYSDGYYQHGYSLAHGIGGDSQMYSIGGNIRFDKMNRVSGRILSANVNQSSLLINQQFPNKDEIQALELTWTHYIQPTMPLKINGWVSDSDLLGQDSGLSVGIELPLDGYLF